MPVGWSLEGTGSFKSPATGSVPGNLHPRGCKVVRSKASYIYHFIYLGPAPQALFRLIGDQADSANILKAPDLVCLVTTLRQERLRELCYLNGTQRTMTVQLQVGPAQSFSDVLGSGRLSSQSTDS